MALQKQPIPINFKSGVDRKSDPWQLPLGNFFRLKNSVFNKTGRLTKRNGFGSLPSLPATGSATFATTFNGNLTAIGQTLQAYSSGSGQWVNKGTIQPLQLNVLPLIRSNTNQIQVDTAISDSGLVCTVYTDNVPSGGSNVATYKYAIADSTTGQNIVAPTVIPVSSGVVTGSPRVFLLGTFFVIVFSNNISGTYHLQYIAINSSNPTVVTVNTDLSASYTPATTVAFDGVVANNRLYLAWNGSDGGGAIRASSLSFTLVQTNTITFASRAATMLSICADLTTSTPTIYISWYNTGDTASGYCAVVDHSLNIIHAPVNIIPPLAILNLASTAQDGQVTIYYEVSNAYSFDASIKTNYVGKVVMSQAGSPVGSPATVSRAIGLASKAFLIDSISYFLGVQSSTYQPTYFLFNSAGSSVAKLAYENGGGYCTLGLPSATVRDTTVSIAYLFKDLVASVNKTQGVASAAGVYSQTGINLASFEIDTTKIVTAEIGSDLHLSGGFLWMYDGYSPVEHGFFLWPEDLKLTSAATGGSMIAQQYFYVGTYEWSDNQGNIFRSAPSVPQTVTTSGSTSKVTVSFPTLRITHKTANPVKLVLYRWSTAQQIYYQITSVSIPLLNDTTVDSLSYVDTVADSAIIGNSILYTTGGVVENIAAPAASTLALFKSRLFLVNAEDGNVLWYSKQVIESVPVEMSDLFTIYVPPTTSAQVNTGPTKCLSAMDDKLIMFKANAIYYMTGTGPDNTGANNDFSDPVFITSTVGCSNQASIVFIPQGLMFQSDKGIWLLGRDLSTSYIGAPVEDFNGYTVDSAVNVPETNQVRFTLSNGTMLMYDYYYNQWGTFEGAPAASSCLYQGLHTIINSNGAVSQETPGIYLDGSNPVLLGWTTGWINLAGLQGFQRLYYFYLIGQFKTPHKLALSIGYDYNSSPAQITTITPDNYAGTYGNGPDVSNPGFFGNPGEYGGNDLEQWRVFVETQKCESFQISLDEIYDTSQGAPAGEGLTLSGLNLVVGLKKGYYPLKPGKSVG